MRDPLRPLQWEDGRLWILDQRYLPGRVKWIQAQKVSTVVVAIRTLAVRGAPAIGIAAAYGVVLASQAPRATADSVLDAIKILSGTRPTGYNLFSALDRMTRALTAGRGDMRSRLLRTALRIHGEDERACRKMAKHGLRLVERGESVLTYCNTGALATGGIGTALGVIKTAYRRKRIKRVYVCETRPLNQGARLTVWECSQAGIPVTLVCDNMAAALMQHGLVSRVLVGADRIARNGDISNKIGTLSLAVLARNFRVAFHVVAPTSTFDVSLRSGRDIPIENRDTTEVTRLVPGFKASNYVEVWNPAFDVTPASLITSFVTERGILHAPFEQLG